MKSNRFTPRFITQSISETGNYRPILIRFLGVFLLAGLIALFVSPHEASTQSSDVQKLIENVRRLELQLATLERDVYQGRTGQEGLLRADAGALNNAALLLIRINELELELRGITGRLETLENGLNRQNDLFGRTLSDIDFRLKIIEESGQTSLLGPVGQGSSASDGTPPQIASAGPRVTLPDSDPQTQYNFAYNFVLNGRFPEAQSAFEAFIEAHPDDPLAGNSQYWIGETFFARGEFESASRAFARGFERYPDSSKVTDNLLKLGISLARLDQDQNACNTFDLLLRDFPQAPNSVRERAARERSLLPC